MTSSSRKPWEILGGGVVRKDRTLSQDMKNEPSPVLGDREDEPQCKGLEEFPLVGAESSTLHTEGFCGGTSPLTCSFGGRADRNSTLSQG